MVDLSFLLITLLSMILFHLGTGRNRKVAVVSIVWIIVAGIIAYSGFFEDDASLPSRFPLIPVSAAALCLYFYRIVDITKVDMRMLLAVHALRFPVELVLHRLYLQRKVPVIMTFDGWNFDIGIGLSAIILLCYSFIAHRKLPDSFFLIWNATGIVFLAVIISIAILSSPVPFQTFAFDQPNVAVLEFPFTYLPLYVVPVVLASHLLAIKALRMHRP